MILIRKAKKKDVKVIREISLEATISNDSDESIGFVNYQTPTEDEYVRRINGNPYFYVAEHNSHVIGFYAAYTNEFLKHPEFKNDPLSSYILSKPKPFIYGEQVAVIKSFRRQGVGKSLLIKLFDDIINTEYGAIWSAISHTPKRNQASIDLTSKLGYSLIEEIGDDGLVFGIYKKKFLETKVEESIS